MQTDPELSDEIRRFEEQYAENPDSLVFARLADLHRKAGRPERALEILDEGLERHPDYLSAHIVRARCLRALDRRRASEEVFRHVLDLDGENLVALRSLAEMAWERGDGETARERLRELLELDPSNEEARDLLGEIREGPAERAGADEVSGPEGTGAAGGEAFAREEDDVEEGAGFGSEGDVESEEDVGWEDDFGAEDDPFAGGGEAAATTDDDTFGAEDDPFARPSDAAAGPDTGSTSPDADRSDADAAGPDADAAWPDAPGAAEEELAEGEHPPEEEPAEGEHPPEEELIIEPTSRRERAEDREETDHRETFDDREPEPREADEPEPSRADESGDRAFDVEAVETGPEGDERGPDAGEGSGEEAAAGTPPDAAEGEEASGRWWDFLGSGEEDDASETMPEAGGEAVAPEPEEATGSPEPGEAAGGEAAEDGPGGPAVGPASEAEELRAQIEELRMQAEQETDLSDAEEDLATETLANLYEAQGFYREAVEMYEELAEQRPDDEDLRRRLERARDALEEAEAASGEAEAASRETGEDFRESTVSAAEELRSVLRGDASPEGRDSAGP